MYNEEKEEHDKFISILKKYRLIIRKKIIEKRREQNAVVLKSVDAVLSEMYKGNNDSSTSKIIETVTNPPLLNWMLSQSAAPPPPPPPSPPTSPSSPASPSPLDFCDIEMVNDEEASMPLQHDEAIHSEYPKQIDDKIILGPNGTECDMQHYSSIVWSSAAAATRQLLLFVFGSDILATHTLSGKPSPAFLGRERPTKMQLDPIKTNDIIHCVHSKFKCTIREIRAAITTKCADISKKYKRRQKKQAQSS